MHTVWVPRANTDPSTRRPEQVDRKRAWAAFAAWAVVGAGLSLGTLSILTIGWLVLAVTAVLGILVVIWRRSVAEAFGAVSGLALPLFYLSYLNRDGPGEVCTTNSTGSTCTDEWSPWPWLVAGVLLAIAGVAAYVSYRQRVRRMRAPAATG